jgi:two-component system response regulator YesN
MLRMMIVDDEALIADAIYDLMDEHFDLELYRCYSAQDALKTIAVMRFDIVITDISMPGMNGLELLGKTQAIWPKCHFLILTAYDNFGYAYETLRHDRVDYLLKLESYDTICACVEKKLKAISAEREQDEQLRYYGSYKQQVEDSMCRYFLKRMILQGIPLPDQRDLDQFSVPIRLDQPVLLALLAMSDQNPLTNNRRWIDIQETLFTQLHSYGLHCLSYISADTVLLAMQFDTGSVLAGDMATYARTVLEALPQSVENATELHLAILCADAPVAWAQMHTLYQYASLLLEKMRNDSGLALLVTADALHSMPQKLTFPSMEELGMLWEMIKCGKFDTFREIFMEHARGIASPAMLPPHTRAAVSYLLLESSRLYGEGDSAVFDALTSSKGYATLQEWMDALVEEMNHLRQYRDASRESRDAWLIVRINQYIEQHYAEELTLTLLATEMHYSPSYISRFYKSGTGTNLMTHLYNVRIQKARELLSDSNDKVSDIAAKTGFCSTKYFNRVFKKVMGISPVQYRRDSVTQSKT